VYFGPIEGEDRQALPQILLAGRNTSYANATDWLSNVSKACQGILARAWSTRSGMGFALWPQAIRRAKVKKLAEFGRNAFVPTGDQRNEDNESCATGSFGGGRSLGSVSWGSSERSGRKV